jgi:phosphohistidine phosphatase
MKLLYLMRHAKSDWDDPELPDIERPLAPRGLRASRDMARRLRKSGVAPSLVLCSTAARARQTLDLIAPALGDGVEVKHESAIYGASPADLIKRLRKVPGSVQSVMIVGHNPTIQELAIGLAGPGGDVDRLRQKFPTAALATLKIDEKSWNKLEPGRGELVGLLTPSKDQ